MPEPTPQNNNNGANNAAPSPAQLPPAVAAVTNFLDSDQAMQALLSLSKSGWRTSEFWFALFSCAYLSIGTWAHSVPLPVAAIAIPLVTIAYHALRAYNKNHTVAQLSSAITNTPVAIISPDDVLDASGARVAPATGVERTPIPVPVGEVGTLTELSRPAQNTTNAAVVGMAAATMLLGLLLLSGCASYRYSGPPVTLTGSYTLPDDRGSLSASTTINPATLRDK